MHDVQQGVHSHSTEKMEFLYQDVFTSPGQQRNVTRKHRLGKNIPRDNNYS